MSEVLHRSLDREKLRSSQLRRRLVQGLPHRAVQVKGFSYQKAGKIIEGRMATHPVICPSGTQTQFSAIRQASKRELDSFVTKKMMNSERIVHSHSACSSKSFPFHGLDTDLAEKSFSYETCLDGCKSKRLNGVGIAGLCLYRNPVLGSKYRGEIDSVYRTKKECFLREVLTKGDMISVDAFEEMKDVVLALIREENRSRANQRYLAGINLGQFSEDKKKLFQEWSPVRLSGGEPGWKAKIHKGQKDPNTSEEKQNRLNRLRQDMRLTMPEMATETQPLLFSKEIDIESTGVCLDTAKPHPYSLMEHSNSTIIIDDIWSEGVTQKERTRKSQKQETFEARPEDYVASQNLIDYDPKRSARAATADPNSTNTTIQAKSSQSPRTNNRTPYCRPKSSVGCESPVPSVDPLSTHQTSPSLGCSKMSEKHSGRVLYLRRRRFAKLKRKPNFTSLEDRDARLFSIDKTSRSTKDFFKRMSQPKANRSPIGSHTEWSEDPRRKSRVPRVKNPASPAARLGSRQPTVQTRYVEMQNEILSNSADDIYAEAQHDGYLGLPQTS